MSENPIDAFIPQDIRDLYAFRAFHECDLIDAAILLTRSASLNAVFKKLGPELNSDGTPKTSKNGKPKLIKTKYGASTTWMASCCTA